MTYLVKLKSSAAKELQRIAEPYCTAIRQKILELKNDAHPVGCKKLSGLDNAWRLRVGAYRIIYGISVSPKEIIILRIAHRQSIYTKP